MYSWLSAHFVKTKNTFWILYYLFFEKSNGERIGTGKTIRKPKYKKSLNGIVHFQWKLIESISSHIRLQEIKNRRSKAEKRFDQQNERKHNLYICIMLW